MVEFFFQLCVVGVDGGIGAKQINNKSTLDNSALPLLNMKLLLRPLLNLSENCLLVTCITYSKRIHEKLSKLSRPQCQIIDVKCEKSQ